ncbi:ASCH domain-containing protein, partial [Streptococcus hyovaginalis]
HRQALLPLRPGAAGVVKSQAPGGEKIPPAGVHSTIRDSQDNACCIIKTTKVYVTPFSQVTEEHAWREGEGDRSLSYWRQVHEKFFTIWLAEAGLTFSEDMLVVCEEFEVVYPCKGE